MKILFYSLLIISSFLISCDDSADATLVGKWIVKDYYHSTGSNDVSYKKATSGWTLEFLEDGTVRSNQKLCGEPVSYEGTYDGQDIIGSGCAPVYYYRLDGKYLIVGGKNCIEDCHSRFVKASFLNK